MPNQFLLDTHVLLWMLIDPKRLSEDAHRVVTDRKNSLFISATSAWEIATKQRLGKLPQADVIVRAYRQHLERANIESIPITDDDSLLAGSMEWPHRDPFDRMIAAQCMNRSLPLISADQAFNTLTGVRKIW